MFFSVIVPVYNVEKYLSQCVDSILNQSFSDFELILVDDGSTDNSPKMCDEYADKDKRVKVIHKENGGAAASRNFGTDASMGKYIVYIDSDDYVDDNEFLNKLYTKANEKDYDIICYKFKKYFESNGQFSECAFSCPDIERYSSLFDKINYMVSCDAFYCAPWAKCFKASAVKDNNIKFENGIIGEDQEWYYHLLLSVNSITFIDEAFIVYRQRNNSVTSSWKMKNLTDCIYVVKKWKDYFEHSDDMDEAYKKALLNSVAKLYCNLLIGYVKFNDKDKKKYYGELKKMAPILKNCLNPRVNTFYKIYKIGGFSLLMLGLKIICKIK